VIAVLAVALLGFLFSAAAHIATFFPPSPILESAWLLNIALCGVWLPLAIIGTRRIFDIVNVGEKWTLIPRHAPDWMKLIAVTFLAYAVFNFLFTMLALNQGGFPAQVDGRYVLHTYNFGVILRELTPAEYTQHRAYLVRASSGHWMFLFLLAAMASYSWLRGKWLERRPVGVPIRRTAEQAE